MENMQNTHSQVIIKKEKNKASQQKTFNRLIKKIQELQAKQEKMVRDLDETLQFYLNTFRPDELILVQRVVERILLIHEAYKTEKSLTKKQLLTIKEWLKEEVGELCSTYDPDDTPAAIKEMFKELHGIGYQEGRAQVLEEITNDFKQEFKDLFNDDIDFSDIDPSSSQEDILRHIFMKMGQGARDFQDRFEQAPKTKKELAKEAKKQAVEELQNKSLQSIYKQLARVLHPDLERDSEMRALKEELMKKLTVAYENDDLFSLLKIEMEWMNHSVNKTQFHNDSEIKVYNAILKDQVEELEMAYEAIFMNPRYLSIQRFYPYRFTGIAELKTRYNQLQRLLPITEVALARIKTAEKNTVLRELIAEQREDMASDASCDCGTC